jgi:hypothetical protein
MINKAKEIVNDIQAKIWNNKSLTEKDKIEIDRFCIKIIHNDLIYIEWDNYITIYDSCNLIYVNLNEEKYNKKMYEEMIYELEYKKDMIDRLLKVLKNE